MPTQRVTIAKLIGDTAVAVTQEHFQRWHRARSMREENTVDPAQWPQSSRAEMNRFAAGLQGARDRPPVCFYLEYVDMWSGGYVFDDYLFGKLPFSLAASDAAEMICYRLPDGDGLLRKVSGELRRRHIRAREPQETRWYLQFLLEAIHAWDGMASTSVIIIIRSVVAGLVTDEEFRAALENAPNWLSAIVRD